MAIVLATEAEPGGRLREVGEQSDQRLRFDEGRDRLASEQIRAAVGKDLDARAMPVNELLQGEPVIAAILAAVGQEGAVAADRRGDEYFSPLPLGERGRG